MSILGDLVIEGTPAGRNSNFVLDCDASMSWAYWSATRHDDGEDNGENPGVVQDGRLTH